MADLSPILSVTIYDTAIRQDAAGRYCLNDLHKASGGEQRHRPNYWLDTQQAKDLVAEVGKSELAGIPAIEAKQGLGTFVAKELVYAYAMWISPAFHLRVIRTFDALVTAAQAPALNPANFSRMQLIELAMQAEQERLVLERQVIELRPRAAALDLIATASAGATNITQAAKALGIGPKALFAWLHAHEWIYRRPGGSGWDGNSI